RRGCSEEYLARSEVERRRKGIERAAALFNRDAPDERRPQHLGILELQIARAPPTVAGRLIIDRTHRASVEAVLVSQTFGEAAVELERDAAIPGRAEQEDIGRHHAFRVAIEKVRARVEIGA